MMLRRNVPFSVVCVLCIAFGVAILAGCTTSVTSGVTPASTTPPADLLAHAAAQATAIIKQAQATALVLQAQSQATSLINQAGGISTEVAPLFPPYTPSPSAASEEQNLTTTATSSGSAIEPTPSLNAAVEVKILSVTYGADGAYIVVNFIATPVAAQTFWPGVLSVTDEASGFVYNEVPVMPVIGPLIARPRELGQPGYVMLVNAPIPLPPGSLVTVILGEYKFEHVLVQ